VEKSAAEFECTGFFELDGTVPDPWAKFSGLYETRDGHVRVHANFDHHRDGVLELLELPDAEHAECDDVSVALSDWSAEAFESAAAENGLVVAMVRSFAEWDAHPHAIATARSPLVSITRIDEARGPVLSGLKKGPRPLSGVRVLDLTRILAGPICGRTLAAYGADVMLVNSPTLPNISSIIDTSRGKRSVHVDLNALDQVETFKHLLRDTHVFVQGYRPGAIGALGFDPMTIAELRPGIVCVSLSAYGSTGPWSGRRGFDSLVQTATGFNHAEAQAAGSSTPKVLPVQILDYASGFLMAFGAQAALLRQAEEGGSWHVEVSLLNTASWLRGLGRLDDGFDVPPPAIKEHLREFPCSEGVLRGMPHAAEFSATPAVWERPSSLPGADEPRW
jgi:crotonobetainyl-CoA:carnitine CoA-transferase CaiB-like acyl-CoA transferase